MTALKKIGGEKRKLVILAVAVAVGAALTWYVKNYVSLEALVAQEEKVREAIDRRPWRSFALGLVIYSVVSLVPGTSGKSVVFAWLFGFWQGLALIILGLTTAAMVIFNLSRYVFHGLDQAPLWAISRGAGQAPAPRRRLLFVNPAHGTFPVHHRQSRQRRQRGAGSNFLLDYVRRLSARISGVRLRRDPHAVAERTVHPRRRLVVRQTTHRGARHQRGLPFRISIRRSETGPTQR